MAGLTLAQTKDLTNDELRSGVIETMAKESKLLAVLPFLTIEGSGYAYNVEKSLATVGFRAINTAYESTPGTKERKTEHLVILGGEAVVDSFQIEVHSNVNDIMAVETALTAKAITYTFEKNFVAGDVAQDANAFDGLTKRAEITIDKEYAQTAVTADKTVVYDTLVNDIDELLDEVQGGADALIMNKATRRYLTTVARDGAITQTKNEFGVQVTQYGGVDIIDVEAEVMPENGKVFALRFGANEAVCGLQSKSGLNVKPLGELGETPQLKTRIEWFCGMAVFNPNTLAMRSVTVTA